jgi:hypothetical protein
MELAQVTQLVMFLQLQVGQIGAREVARKLVEQTQ